MSKTITVSMPLVVTFEIKVEIRDGMYFMSEAVGPILPNPDEIVAAITSARGNDILEKCAAVLGPLPEPEDA